jgi:uncharacterized membrane protein YeaQ/YmgE (transglycosylase-associated protein family)
MLILALIGFGMLIGAIAQLIVGKRSNEPFDWGMALAAGLLGSFVGGLIASLLAGDGLALRASGTIGSLVGAVIITAIWKTVAEKKVAAQLARPAPGTRPPTSADREATRRPGRVQQSLLVAAVLALTL